MTNAETLKAAQAIKAHLVVISVQQMAMEASSDYERTEVAKDCVYGLIDDGYLEVNEETLDFVTLSHFIESGCDERYL